MTGASRAYLIPHAAARRRRNTPKAKREQGGRWPPGEASGSREAERSSERKASRGASGCPTDHHRHPGNKREAR